MNTSTELHVPEFPDELVHPPVVIEQVDAPGIALRHPAEADLFARQADIPGHDQDMIGKAHFTLVGAGGLNSWVALGLLRAGAREITIIDFDRVERSNTSRQLFYDNDIGQLKATRLAHNLAVHAVAGAHITGVALRLDEVVDQYILPGDILIVGVDNNPCRRLAVELARARRIPAVFTMLSRDGMRCQSFLQGPDVEDACLWCALPNLEVDKAMPCAAAIIQSCFFAAAFSLFFSHRALMGWPPEVPPFNWREGDLLGLVPDRVGNVTRRDDCPICGKL